MNADLRIVRPGFQDPVDLQRLARMRPDELRELHHRLFGCDLLSGNSGQARRKIAWRLQAERYGDLPASARQRALAIARVSTIRVRLGNNLERRREGLPLHHAVTTRISPVHDSRIPMPGSVLVKEHKGRTIIVHVLDSGFEYDGKRFTSLSAVATAITGTKWNGMLFFGLTKERSRGH
jgi:hypothetical protein